MITQETMQEREEQVLAQDAQADLRAILDAIRDDEGPDVARAAAQALRLAAVEGRIYGQEYGQPAQVPLCGCALGHLATVTGWASSGAPDVPGWDYAYWRREVCDYSPLERWVLRVMPGQTPDTSPRLAALVSWLDSYA